MQVLIAPERALGKNTARVGRETRLFVELGFVRRFRITEIRRHGSRWLGGRLRGLLTMPHGGDNREAGGDCRIETARARGTTIFLTLPLPASVKPVS